MTEEASAAAPDAPIAEAFEELRREISLTRHAVEGLTAARERIPDYTPTLASIATSLKETRATVSRIEDSPAMRLSPGAMAVELVKASSTARAEDARILNDVRNALSRSIGHVDAIVKRGKAADRQLRDKLFWTGGGMAAGILLWSVLPGAVARSLPQSWHVPEWMAARTIDLPVHSAGERMIAASGQAKSTALPVMPSSQRSGNVSLHERRGKSLHGTQRR